MSDLLQKTNVINDRILCSWIRCKRKAWLDRNEKKQLKTWTSHRALQLDHQYKSLSAFMQKSPKRGLQACKEGANEVVGIRLKGRSPLGIPLEAHPPLLLKIRGKSSWGDFSYIPVVARQGKRITREHRLSLAFYGYLLTELQKKEVDHGLAISLGNNGLEISKVTLTKKIKSELFDALKNLNITLKKKELPSLTLDRKKCALCSWKKLCDANASKEKDLSEVSGIGSKRKHILQEIGVKDLNELALCNVDDLIRKLEKYGEHHSKIAEQLINQAKVQKEFVPKKLNSKIILPELKSAKGILIYDIESDPDVRHDFLHGFVSLKRNVNGDWDIKESKYEPILNLKKQEKITWSQINNKIKNLPNWPIIHYGETEVLSMIKLAKNNGASEEDIDNIKNNFIDIHARLKSAWLLPVKNYSLKSVAKWIDFKWHQKNVDGPKALLWWRQWINNNNSNLLKWILEYNHDDCIATWKIAEWMIKRNELSQK